MPKNKITLPDIVTRDRWGAKQPTKVTFRELRGPTTVHWNGTSTRWDRIGANDQERFDWMVNRLQAVQSFHMNGRGWNDIAYNFGIDPWGLAVWRLRGLDIRSGAQGTRVGNNTSHALYIPTGAGDPDPTPECLALIDSTIAWISEQTGAENTALGHRDWKQTGCPGDFLYESLASINLDDEDDDQPDENLAQAKALTDVAGLFNLGDGYGVVDSGGAVQVFGATHLGDLRDVALVAPIVDAEGTNTGNGYYLAAADGGVFCFGDARFHGSMGGTKLNAPVVGIEVGADGYWLVAEDGGIFTFGEEFHGRPDVSAA